MASTPPSISMALADPKQLDAAVKLLEEFKSRDHYRHYDAVELLGELYLVQKDFIKAAEGVGSDGGKLIMDKNGILVASFVRMPPLDCR